MTGFEPATSGVTGRCSNQLSYIPKDSRPLQARLVAVGKNKISHGPGRSQEARAGEFGSRVRLWARPPGEDPAGAREIESTKPPRLSGDDFRRVAVRV